MTITTQGLAKYLSSPYRGSQRGSGVSLNLTESPLLSRHRLRHRQGRGGGGLTDSHRRLLRFEAGGWAGWAGLGVRHKGCRKTHSRDSPSDRHGTRPSGSLRRRACCEPQGAGPLSGALSAPTRRGTRAHRQYLHGRGRALVGTSSCNSSALAE